MTNFFETLIEVLQADERFFTDEGTLLRNKVYESAMNMDAGLIGLLLTNDNTKSRFFVDVNGTLVFDKVGFGWVVNNRQFLPDSYTRFKNRIGLSDSRGDLISASNDVVLSFPYKDCVLEGGQTKDNQKRDEVFYNETLAPDEVDRLLYPKVLTGAQRYTYSGPFDLVGNPAPCEGENVSVTPATTFSDTENLIIKGNNLLAISSLLKRYEGRINCIYIDVPYNTGNDGFSYNDKFNHSTWLVFIKNRMQIAKRLLSAKGSIFVQIDAFEEAYLKVLLDEIFGRENFRNLITWKRRGGSANPSSQLNNVSDYILWYSKDVTSMQYSPVYSLNDENTQQYIKERFVFSDENGRKFMKSPIQSPNLRENLKYDYKGYKTPAKGYSISLEVMKKWDEEGKLCFPDSKDKNINRKIYLDEYQGQPINSLWTDIYVINPMSNERLEFVGGQKPEGLIQRVLQMVTKEGDIILDFCLGSGTTAATAHKMNRQYIGVEQMDYIDDLVINRLKGVISGEKNGISKDVNWQGGGSFVFCELAKNNKKYEDEVICAKSDANLIDLLDRVLNSGFISSKVNPAQIAGAASEFEDLSIENKKRFILELLDKNMLYVNLCDLDDEEYAINDADKAFTRSFYRLEDK